MTCWQRFDLICRFHPDRGSRVNVLAIRPGAWEDHESRASVPAVAVIYRGPGELSARLRPCTETDPGPFRISS